MKMYILIRETVPSGIAITAAAHAAMVCERDFGNTPYFKTWKREHFFKAVCVVDENEWERAKAFDSYSVVTESKLDNAEVALVFCPREDDQWPKAFKYYRLWGKHLKGN